MKFFQLAVEKIIVAKMISIPLFAIDYFYEERGKKVIFNKLTNKW